MLLNVNGETFLLKSYAELTSKIKREIEIICQLAYDEDESIIQENLDDDIYDATVFDIAEAFQKAVKAELNIDIKFQAINFEVNIRE